MFDVQFTYSQGALCYLGNNQEETARLNLIDKVVMSNSVKVTLVSDQAFLFGHVFAGLPTEAFQFQKHNATKRS